MSESGEFILGFCTLPLEDDSPVDIVHEEEQQQDPPFLESEVITGDIGDFPIFRDECQEEGSIRCIQPTFSVVCVESDNSSETLTASETSSLRGPPSPNSSVMSMTEHITNVSTIGNNKAPVNRSSAVSDEKKRRHGSGTCTRCFQKYDREKQCSCHPFSCLTCPRVFSWKSSRDLHMKHDCHSKHAQSQIRKKPSQDCPLCYKCFRSSSSLKEHIIASHNKVSPFYCPVCRKLLTNCKRTIESHISRHVSKLECPVCSIRFESNEKLDVHIQEESQEKGHLKCCTCQSNFSERTDFFSHVPKHLPDVSCMELMICQGCKLKFRSTKEFVNHVTEVCVETKAYASGSDIECIDIRDEEDDVIPISDDDVNLCDSNTGSTVVQSFGLQWSAVQSSAFQQTDAQSFTLQASEVQSFIVEPSNIQSSALQTLTLQSSAVLSSDVQSPTPGTTVVLIPQIVYLPTTRLASDEHSSTATTLKSNISPSLSSTVSLPVMTTQPTVTETNSATVSQPSEERVFFKGCMKSEIIDALFLDSQKENIEIMSSDNLPEDTEENESCLQLHLQNVYSLAEDKVHPSEFTTDKILTCTDGGDCSDAETVFFENCSSCWQWFKDPESLKKHVAGHTDFATRYPCPRCYSLFTLEKSLQRHVEELRCKKISPSTFVCGECGGLFSYESHIREHRSKAHSQFSSIPCPVCKKVLPHGANLNDHLVVVHKLHIESVGNGISALRDLK